MAEGRETDAVAERPVELAYRPTVGELASALRARARSTGAGRFQRGALVWTVAVTTIGALLSAAGSGHRDTPWPLYAGVVVFVAFMTAVPWLQARRLHRLAERQGDICGTVDDTGVRLTTAHSSASHDWHPYSRYAETPELFVLLSADKSAVGFAVLPKRAVADPEDVDRLRAVLDRRLVRADDAKAPGSPRSRGRAVGRGAGSVGLLLLGLLLFFFAFAAVQRATHPDRFPGIQNNTAPVSAVMLGLGALAVAGAWWLVRRMTAMRIS
ncbi:YcxB family protein [Streptomyces sp. NPDC048254]|uniref:YcxB family protein n=1 Tax=Streptomyces sp. NPDC048254 TaxID=3365525 RepID=UPI00371103F2